MDWWMNASMDGWMDAMDGWMDGWWMDGWMMNGWMDDGWMMDDRMHFKNKDSHPCTTCKTEIYLQPIWFIFGLSENRFRNSHVMDGMNNGTKNKTKTDKHNKMGLCQVHHCCSGGLMMWWWLFNEQKCRWLDELTKHAFVTRKKKHPLGLPQIYLRRLSGGGLAPIRTRGRNRKVWWAYPSLKYHSAYFQWVKLKG